MSGDLISRNALLSKMFPYGMPDNGNYGINARAVRDAVVGAKAVEAEPVVHAYWICDCEPYHICSNCRHKFSLFDRVPRCPNCGAHMDEEVSNGSAN